MGGSTTTWVSGTSLVGESQLGAATREWSHGPSGATIHGIPVERITKFRGGDWKVGPDGKVVGGSGDGLLSGLSSGEHQLYRKFCDEDSRDGDYVSPVKRGAVRPAARPTRTIAGTPSPALPSAAASPPGGTQKGIPFRAGEDEWEEIVVGPAERGD
ncbi:unnamed protein product [Tuber melanosporum]|uniref:(Perigord truffle) hypothetical protein n=1 Tax=Tuber melanosporum (strain Mel28) TaxID=656061 RepID=D5GJ62_TUBMM|nr:uncharacterized protein GSTUM_00008853001 [Tuber melanosporum]CAZ84555.1 unnamed protein product [Tuber melanosporum]